MPKERLVISDAEKLILLMLSDIHDHLKIKGDTDTAFLREAIYSGNLWGLDWKMTGVFGVKDTPESVVTETVDILSMWERLEQSYEALSDADKKWIEDTVGHYGKYVHFSGFDGNNESEYINAASFLIGPLERFSHFKGRRDLNSHMPSVPRYLRMYGVFEPILMEVVEKDFSKEQIAEVLKASER